MIDVMYKHFYKHLPSQVQKKIEPPETQLIRYNNGKNGTKLIRFVIIYNIIFGRIEIHKFRVIASTIHNLVKFHTMSGVDTIPTKKRAGKIE